MAAARTVAGIVALLLLAGCASTAPAPSATTTSPAGTHAGSGSSSASASPHPSTSSSGASQMCPPHCFEGRRLHLEVVVADRAPRQVGVPFPHGAWCLQPDQWSQQAPAHNATAGLRDAGAGRSGTVLWVASSGQGSVQWSVDVTNRSTCATFRYDPWSIDPDPADGTLDVQADGASPVIVYVGDEHGPCTTYTQYNGTTAAGWSTLAEGWNGTACA